LDRSGVSRVLIIAAGQPPMQNIEIILAPTTDPCGAEMKIAATLMTAGLDISRRGTLKKFPGCIHWHAKRRGQAGTLEITLWPRQHRAWITIQSGRRANWITDQLPTVLAALQLALKSP
jgi:hypothetical protein